MDAAAAQAIRETVESVVFDSLDFWYQYTDSTPEDPDGVGDRTQVERLKVYPNPASGRLHIELSEAGSRGYELILHNAMGAQVLRTTVTGGTADIDVQHLPAGLYTLSCRPKGEDGTLLRTKFVKE